MMRAVQKFCPIFTLCVGNAFGEAALLLAAGSKVGLGWAGGCVGAWVEGRGGRQQQRLMRASCTPFVTTYNPSTDPIGRPTGTNPNQR